MEEAVVEGAVVEEAVEPPPRPPEPPLAGIIIRVYLCWNFGRLVPGVVKSHRCSTKTHESYHLCALFGH